MALKRISFLIVLLLFGGMAAHCQLGTTIFVSGQHILGPCGDTLLLRGVNYAAFNWGWSPGQSRIAEIAQTGANCVRIPWYATPAQGTPQTTYGDLVNLDTILSHCVQYQLIPIIELHDMTCANDTVGLEGLMAWWTQPGVLALIEKYKHSIILNLANEALYVSWTGSPTTSRQIFARVYGRMVQTLRTAGVTAPIMIDGPDCGQNLDALATLGQGMLADDPAHNLIFSAHSYWYAFAANDSTLMAAKVDNAIGSGIPFVLGEVANLQDGITNCQFQLNLDDLLEICQSRGLHWLAWSWEQDVCPDRQISSNGLFSSLTSYGDNLVHHPDYGILNVAPARSAYLFNGGSCAGSTGLDTAMELAVKLWPNPARGHVWVDFGYVVPQAQVLVMDMSGRTMLQQEVRDVSRLEMELDLAKGMYLLQVDAGEKGAVRRRLVVE